jgi:adenine-specific DNA-methyltransferase
VTPDRRLARDLAAGVAVEHRLGFARGFAFAAVQAYVAAAPAAPRLPPLPDGLALVPLHDAAVLAASRFAAGLVGLGVAEAVYRLGSLYTGVLPADFRAAHGVFYTPPEIVRATLDMAERAGTDWRQARCLDPSAGGGGFLVEIIRRIRSSLGKTEPALVLSRLAAQVRGQDVDPFGAWVAEVAVRLAVADLEAACGRALPPLVAVRDSLDQDGAEHGVFDLVASNVPFGRVSLPPARRALYARSTYGHANLYGLFTDAALRYAKPRGVIAYVMPTSMLSGLYFQSLRALLRQAAPPAELTFVTERAGVFDDALQETMLATYRCGRRNRSVRVNFLSIDAAARAHLTAAGRFRLPDAPAAPWLLPRHAQHVRLVDTLARMPHRLADYGFTVSTGPLVWNRHKTQFAADHQRRALPVIWAEAVSSDGRFIWRAAKRNHAPWFVPRPGVDDWLITDRPCVLLQRTTAKEQDRRLIATELPAEFVARHRGVVIENHINMIRTRSDTPPVGPAVIAAVLNSRAADMAFRCISGSVAVSAYELAALPLPPPDVIAAVDRLLQSGAPAAAVERTIAAAYGLDDAAATP